MERVNLLVTDLDGTLLGDDRALGEFLGWYADNDDWLRLVYSSGRFPDSIRESIETYGLPHPDGIIGGVGTEIYDLRSGQRLDDWPPNADRWDPEMVRATCALMSELVEQPGHLLSRYKVSYFGHDLDAAFLNRLERQLADAGINATVVYSSNRDLDILPGGTTKGTAAAHLAKRWGIAQQRVMVAGDTGNDADMFCRDFRGIVVGNALPELKALRGPNVYHAAGHFAAGVLEGLQHWVEKSARESVATSGRAS